MRIHTIKIVMSSRVNGDGKSSLYLRGTRKRKNTLIAIGESVKPKDWDEKGQQAKSSHKNSARLNYSLGVAKTRLSDIMFDLAKKDDNYSLQEAKKIFLNNDKHDFYKLYESYMKQFLDKGKIGSYRKILSVLTKLKEYRKDKPLYLEDVNVEFLQKYEVYLSVVKKNTNNTIHSNLKVFRKVINDAVQNDLIPSEANPFRKFKIKTDKVSTVYLTENEVENIENVEFNKGSLLDEHRKLFVFGCYTGIRIRDLLLLEWKNFIDEERLEIYTSKTKALVSIKLPDNMLELLRYFKPKTNNTRFIFPFVDKNLDLNNPILVHSAVSSATAYANKNLRIIAHEAKINKKISFHKSRHTFATLLLKKGVRIEYVSKLLGHANIQMTQHYAKIVNSELDKAMEVFNKK